jgi:short-subunit dehydrogenase
VLVNNAGYGYLAAIEEGEDDEVRAMFETNIFGLIALTKAVLPGMRARRKGHIVNFSSIGGLVSFPATGYYHATKYAVEGLSESLAQELSPLGIKVLIVEPGPFRTDWAGRSIKQSKTRLPDYEQTAGKRRTETEARSGNQAGDPARGVQAIIKASKQKTHRYALCSANRRSISLTKSSKRLRQTSMPGRTRRRALIFRTRSRKRLSDPLALGVDLPGARSLHRRPLRSRWFAYLEWRPFQAFGFLTKPGKNRGSRQP